MMNLAVTQDRWLLINPGSASAQHLLNKRTPTYVSAPLFWQRIVINRPAICALQHSVARCRFGMLHDLLRLLPATPGANPDMDHVIAIEHFGLRECINRFQ